MGLRPGRGAGGGCAARARAPHGGHPPRVSAGGSAAAGARRRRRPRRTNPGHRHFIALFRREVGLAPKLLLRLLRFQRAVAALSSGPLASLAAVTQDAGYADQAHLTREFRALAGITPGRYRSAPALHPNHAPLVNSVQDEARRLGRGCPRKSHEQGEERCRFERCTPTCG
ncbi:MAG TPA: helix-turn-helix domain-containing protein [Vulgatibacter sp.]|nr:helix-turn-helix domain-containing protein [Vulgatibacter sp.]